MKKLYSPKHISRMEAIVIYERVAGYCKKLLKKVGEEDWMGDKFDDLVCKKFGGECFNTGGNCMVTYIPLSPYYYIGVTEEVVVLYHKSDHFSRSLRKAENCCEDASEGCGENEVECEYLYQ